MKPALLFLLLAAVCYGACKKDNTTTTLNGVTYTIARCSGLIGITDRYKLSNGKLYGNDTATALPAAKYIIAKNLAEALPQYFFSHPDSAWGCPNCADGPALFITWQKDSINYQWSIDEMNTDLLPPAVAAYASRANGALDSLK